MFVLEQALLGGGPAGGGESAEAAVGAEDAVAGDDQRDRVGGHGAADGAGGSGVADLGGQGAIRRCSAGSDLAAGQKYLAAEGPDAIEANGRISTEINGFALKVGHDPLLQRSEKAFFETCVLRMPGEPCKQIAFRRGTVRIGQRRPADGIVAAGQTEITPLSPKTCIVQHLQLLLSPGDAAILCGGRSINKPKLAGPPEHTV